MNRPAMLAALVALALPAAPAAAVVVLFSDFESVASPDFARRGYAVLNSAGGWTAGPAGIEVQTNNVAGRAYSGRNLVELDSTRNSSMSIELPKGSYTVSYWYSPRPNVEAASNAVTLSLGDRLLDFAIGAGGRQTLWQHREVGFRTPGGRLTFAAAGRSDSLGGYLDDISISAVPETSTWVMLIAGFGLVGAAARRRRREAAA